MAFVGGPALHFSGRRHLQRLLPSARLGDGRKYDQWDGQDTFSGFEALCWRTQGSLCAETAKADGLGTFEATPAFMPGDARRENGLRGPARRARAMRGGRAFSSAVVSVWRAAPPASGRARLLTHLTPESDVRHAAEAVGLSLRLEPRNPIAPLLRADAHYFQLGGGATAWWFSGAADLVPGPRAAPNAFGRDARLFLARCRAPCAEHRASPELGEKQARARFLEACLAVHSIPPEGGHDQAAAFAFMVDVLDVLLPSYLPLVRPGEAPDLPAHSPDPRPEFTERFGLRGGASCESEVAQVGPFGSWRFTLAPREGSPEGKRFWSMRNDENAGRTPPAYM